MKPSPTPDPGNPGRSGQPPGRDALTPGRRPALSWLALAAAVVGCLLLVPLRGSSDVPEFWLKWIGIMREHGLVRGYALCFSDYTPLAFVFLRAVTGVADTTGVGLHLVLKSGIALFALASATLFWLWSRNPARTAALLFALLLVAPAQGYLDIVYLPPLFLSLWSLSRGRGTAASFWFAVACSVKWQPLIVAPFFLVQAGRASDAPRSDGRRAAAPWQRVLLGVLPVALVWVLGFGAEPLARSLLKALSHPGLSYQALNPGWLIELRLSAADPAKAGIPPYELAAPWLAVVGAKIAFLSSYGYLLYTFLKRGQSFADFLWSSGVGAFAYYVCNTGVHENHLFLATVYAFALLGVAGAAGRPLALYGGVMLNLNLAIFNGLEGTGSWLGGGRGWPAIALCGLNVVALAVCLRSARRLIRPTGSSQTAAAAS